MSRMFLGYLGEGRFHLLSFLLRIRVWDRFALFPQSLRMRIGGVTGKFVKATLAAFDNTALSLVEIGHVNKFVT